MQSIDLVELKKQQQRYSALLSGAKRGIYASPMALKGSMCKLQHRKRMQSPHVALGRKVTLPRAQNDHKSSGLTVQRGTEGKSWKVMVNQEFWNESTSNKSINTTDSQSKSGVRFPPIRNCDKINLVNNAENGHTQGSHLTERNQSQMPNHVHVIASGLSSFVASARFNSSRLDSGRLFRGDGCTSQQSGRICSGVGDPHMEPVLEDRPNSTGFPDMTEILLERAHTWRDKLSYMDWNNRLTRAPTAFQPKDWTSFRPEFTKPYTYSYFSNTTHN